MDQDFVDSILRRKALEKWFKMLKRTKVGQERALSKEDVVSEIREMVKGDRGREIVDNALRLYGDLALRVFRRLVEARRSGRVRELWDYQLYELLERLGMRIPVSTKIRVVKHGEVRELSELLDEQA